MYSYLHLHILAYYLHITLMISINLFQPFHGRGAFITQDCTDGMHWNLCGSESNIHTYVIFIYIYIIFYIFVLYTFIMHVYVGHSMLLHCLEIA